MVLANQEESEAHRGHVPVLLPTEIVCDESVQESTAQKKGYSKTSSVRIGPEALMSMAPAASPGSFPRSKFGFCSW